MSEQAGPGYDWEHLPSQRRYEDDGVWVKVCDRCAALVLDEGRHNAWHSSPIADPDPRAGVWSAWAPARTDDTPAS